jgi:hypothetical protein
LPRLFTLAVISGLTAFCVARDCAHDGARNATVAEVLWLPSEAEIEPDAARAGAIENGRSIYIDGSASVVFRIQSDRDVLSSGIVKRFVARGWRERQTQYLNPEVPTSFQGGWQGHDGVGDTHRTVSDDPYRRWHDEWTDECGNIVTYSIGGQGRELRGIASYIPRSMVSEGLKKLGR